MTSIDQPPVSPPAGRGRLAAVLATRGGKAAPEAPFVIEHREALIYMLCEAAELEHGIMCQYLFAAFSLKQSAAENLSEAEAAAVQRWRKQVSHVATQEMLHLALVHNLLSAVGAAPHMARPNLPQPANHYPAGVQLALLPFGEQALRHFIFLERPEGMDLADAEGLAAMGNATPVMNERDIVPGGQDFATVGHLYRSIEAGLDRLCAKYGEDWLFVGPPRAQATAGHFGWPELVAVTDLASARRAVEEILEQGEGPRGQWRDAHFGQFVNILDEYQQLREANPDFNPVRTVLAANVRAHERGSDVPLITDPLTARVADLFNVGYEILLQIFERYFAHTEESDAELKTLADATISLMLGVIKPLGDLITILPVGPDHLGMTAGPSFELFYETDYLMPHRDAAWALLAERLDEAAWLCEAIQTGRGTQIADKLAPILAGMREISRALAARLPAGSPHARLAVPPVRLTPAELGSMLHRAGELAKSAPPDGAGTAGQVGSLIARAHSAVVSAAAGNTTCTPAEQAVLLPRLIDSVLRPLADALNRAPAGPDGQPGQPGPGRREAGAGDAAADGLPAHEQVWRLAIAATSLRAQMAADSVPPELAEAVAALQDLSCRVGPAAEAANRRAELWRLQAGLAPMIQAMHNGPYLVTNAPRLVNHLGTETEQAPQLALCRCGRSAIKPLCDGSHARAGFTDAKDPNRVPDHRDTYPGQQLTIFDNRGICQHSGFCTDRLATVFRAGTEPFVAPSGGRMDEIIRAVRECPSGALSYAVDGTEAREHVDWAGTRRAAIEVTKDGPYRVTGAIPLAGADGAPVPRAEGASTEHYALCRCGQSQNKPFCSGMHWYVGFRDPELPDGYEPTLFEWAGGVPALTRMTRLLYEKHVPADPLLAELFADMPADQPGRLAAWLAEALGGPTADLAYRGPELASQSGRDVSDDQRTRWVALASQAADDAKVPADAGFRSALLASLDWRARTGLAPSDQQAAAAVSAAVPRWDWGPGGPPPKPAGQADGAASAEPEPALPEPGTPLSFAAHIRPLFRERDRQSMSFAFDLGSYDDVRGRAAEILGRLRDGSMPCDGGWAKAKIDVFQRWTESGAAP